MSSWIIIDGYNLLHSSGVFGEGGRTSLESSREALLAWLVEQLGSDQSARTTIVFDARDAPPGLPRSYRHQGLTVRFAPRDRDADTVIEELVQQHSSPRRLVVVSSDHRIHRAAKRRRATAIDSEVWVEQLRRDRPSGQESSERPDTVDEDERSDWLREFGYED